MGLGSGLFTIIITLGSTVFGLAITGFTIWFVWKKVLGPIQERQAQAQRLMQTGYPAQARILQLVDTGMKVNDNPQVTIVLEVHAQGRPPWHAQVTTIVSMLAIPRVQPGTVVAIRYDPMNPMNVAIEGM